MKNPYFVQTILLPFIVFVAHISYGSNAEDISYLKERKTETIIIPTLYQEFVTFIDFDYKMDQREFRYSIPNSWVKTESMYSKRQNRNMLGDYDEGYFEYSFNPSHTKEPQIKYEFWDSKVSRASAIAIRTKEYRELWIVRNELERLLTKRYGVPTHRTNRESYTKIEWSKENMAITLDSYIGNMQKPVPVNHLELSVVDTATYPLLKDFTNTRGKAKSDGTYVSNLCTRKLENGHEFEIALSTDTDGLLRSEALIIGELKRGAMEESGYKCQMEIMDKSILPGYGSAEKLFEGKRIMKTYLHFKDIQGKRNVLMFLSAKGRVEDVVCDAFREEMGTGSLEAKCIGGTEIIR